MKTFEEIFDSIEKEMKEEEKRKKEEEITANEKRMLKHDINKNYHWFDEILDNLSLAKKFIKEKDVMNSIFKDFSCQVRTGAKVLKHNIYDKYDEYADQICIIKDILYVNLKKELPSYDIQIISFTTLVGCCVKFCINIKAKKRSIESDVPKEIGEITDKEIKPYIFIEKFDNEIRGIIAQKIFEILEKIPHLDQEVISDLQKIGIVKEYQPMKVEPYFLLNHTNESPTYPEIIDIRLYSDIDNGVIEKLGNLFAENDGTHHYDRTFFYYTENDICYIRCVKSWGLKEI